MENWSIVFEQKEDKLCLGLLKKLLIDIVIVIADILVAFLFIYFASEFGWEWADTGAIICIVAIFPLCFLVGGIFTALEGEWKGVAWFILFSIFWILIAWLLIQYGSNFDIFKDVEFLGQFF
jgi:predicted permease